MLFKYPTEDKIGRQENMATDISFKEIFPVLKNQFKSIDMRGIFALSHDEGFWRIAFLKLYFTKLDTPELKRIHKNICTKYKIEDREDFRIIFEAKKIDEVETIFKEITNMQVRMSNLVGSPMGTNYQNIHLNDSFVTKYRLYINRDEIDTYSKKALISKSEYKPIDVINHCKVNLENYPIKFSDLIYPLAINDIGQYSDLIIILPLYCKQLENDSKEYIAKFEIHNKLTHGSNATLTLRDDTEKLLENSGTIDIETLIENYKEEMNIFYLPKFQMPIENYHKILVRISHKDIGDLFNDTITGHEINKDNTLAFEGIKDFNLPQLESNGMKPPYHPKKIFIVHGHDGEAKQELARMLIDFGLEPIILHERPDGGRILIEKFEGEIEDIGYAFILLTPDDHITLHRFNKKTHAIDDQKLNRSRQNVVFEMGYFMGNLGRKRVCCIHREDIEMPSDLIGIVYKPYDKSLEKLYKSIRNELKNAGYEINEK